MEKDRNLNKMCEYIKRSIAVNAKQFTASNKNAVYSWARSIQMNIMPSEDISGSPTLIIPTLEGDMICSINDYLIQEPFPTDWRKLYPCKKEIFEKTYELADKESQSSSE